MTTCGKRTQYGNYTIQGQKDSSGVKTFDLHLGDPDLIP